MSLWICFSWLNIWATNEYLIDDENEQKIHPLNQRSPELHSFDSHSIKSQSEKLIGLEDKPFAFREKEYNELNSNRFEYQSNKSITDHSLNEICLFINKKPELKADSADFWFPNEGALCAPSIPEIKKKSRRKIDPVTEKKQQNFEWYKEFWKLKLIHNLITKELKSIQEDDEQYEQKLNIINENKERHENDLGYYLGIEDSRRKRIRRLATEIERKHRCLVPKCSKAYGSEGSLNQHLIRKHPLVFEEWMKRITEKENESQPKKSIISREDKNQIRKEIEKMCAVLCKDEDSNYDNSDSD